MKGKESKKVSTNEEWSDWKNNFKEIIAKTLKNARMRMGELGYPNTRNEIANETKLPHQVIVHAEQGKGNIAFIMLLIEFYNKRKAVNTKDLDEMYEYLRDSSKIPNSTEEELNKD
jgi:DNA-directed RNA polymerase specialized sigma subunit